MQIFQRRGLLINEEMIKSYLRKHIQTLWGVKKEDNKRSIKKRTKIEKENDQ